MTKLILITISLAYFILISSCSFFTGRRASSSPGKQCVSLSATNSFNMQDVCVNDGTFILRTKTIGKIKEIDVSKMENEKVETIFFLIEDKVGHKIKINGNDLVLNKKGLCVKLNDNKQLCVGSKFNSLSDGNDRVVLGFALTTTANQNLRVFTNGINDKLIRSEPTLDVLSSIIATKTGVIDQSATCRETPLLKTESRIIDCAKKELIKEMDKVCDVFRHGNGRVVADIESKSIKSECSKKYSMFGSSTKICSAILSAKCERTKVNDGLVIVQPAISADEDLTVMSEVI